MQTISGIFNYLPEKHRHHVSAASAIRRNQTVCGACSVLHYHFPAADTYIHSCIRTVPLPRNAALSLNFFFCFLLVGFPTVAEEIVPRAREGQEENPLNRICIVVVVAGVYDDDENDDCHAVKRLVSTVV